LQEKIKQEKDKNKDHFKVFDNARTIPAWRFFEIIHTGELRYLLDSDNLPEYWEHLLEPVWDKILIEDDEQTNKFIFKNAFLDKKYDIIEYNEYLLLRACLNMMKCGDERALKHLEYVDLYYDKINENTIKNIERKVRSIETLLNIEKAKYKKNEPVKNNYIEKTTLISRVVGIRIDPYIVTLSEWRAYDHQFELLTKPKNG
jgi:hypothetical protein